MRMPAVLPNGHSHAWSKHWTGDSKSGASWNLFCGDARKVLQSLEPGKYSCVITSPPYYWQRDYKVSGQIGLEKTIEDYVTAVCDVMDGVNRVLSNNGTLFLNLGDTYYSGKGKPQGRDPKHNGRRMSRLRVVDTSGLGKPKKTLLGMPWRVALEMINRGWVLRSAIIWRRENALPEANALDRPWRTYENVFLFVKKRYYNFNRRVLIDIGEEDIWTLESRPRSGGTHPAVFPTELVLRCLKIGNPKYGPVLDPFAGSATVITTALQMGIDADGIDLNRKYCQAAVRSLRSF